MKFRPNSDDAVETLEEITKPASDLLNDPEFFKGAICQILDTVTENIGVEKPTSAEASDARLKSMVDLKRTFSVLQGWAEFLSAHW